MDHARERRVVASRSNRVPEASGLELPLGVTRADTRCILRDAYDDYAFASLIRQNRALASCSRRGTARLRTFPELLADLFCLYFKLGSKRVDRDRLRPAFRVNHHLITRLADESSLRRLRAETGLSEERAAEATLKRAEALIDELANTDLDQENRLFEFEQSLDEGGQARGRPGRVRRKAVAGAGAHAPTQSDQRGRRPLAYDIQERLERSEALADALRLERMLALREALHTEFALRDEHFAPPREVYDIGLCGELARLLPAEFVGLRASALRRDFLRRLLERRLLGYRLSGATDPPQLLILIDGSHSMEGEKEWLAKGLALAIAEIASEREQRATALIFGHRGATPRSIDFAGRRPGRTEIETLASTFFGGGTDFERPLTVALERIAKAPDGRGRIVLITDGLCTLDPNRIEALRLRCARQRVSITSFLVDAEPDAAAPEDGLAAARPEMVAWHPSPETVAWHPNAEPRTIARTVAWHPNWHPNFEPQTGAWQALSALSDRLLRLSHFLPARSPAAGSDSRIRQWM